MTFAMQSQAELTAQFVTQILELVSINKHLYVLTFVMSGLLLVEMN